jgi:hypothetical protein
LRADEAQAGTVVAAFLMTMAGASNTVIALALGKIVDGVAAGSRSGSVAGHVSSFAGECLG